MKKIIVAAFLIFALVSCGPPHAEPVENHNQPLKIQVGKNMYSITRVYLGNAQGYIYIMAPDSANVEVPISMGYTQGKTHPTIIKVK
jgi:hypothetical protein